MSSFLVIPDRDDATGFRLASVVGWALNAYARCYNGGEPATWPEHNIVVAAVIEGLGQKLDQQQTVADIEAVLTEATLAKIPFIAIGNGEPIPDHLPPELFRVIAQTRRTAGWDEQGRHIARPGGA